MQPTLKFEASLKRPFSYWEVATSIEPASCPPYELIIASLLHLFARYLAIAPQYQVAAVRSTLGRFLRARNRSRDQPMLSFPELRAMEHVRQRCLTPRLLR